MFPSCCRSMLPDEKVVVDDDGKNDGNEFIDDEGEHEFNDGGDDEELDDDDKYEVSNVDNNSNIWSLLSEIMSGNARNVSPTSRP